MVGGRWTVHELVEFCGPVASLFWEPVLEQYWHEGCSRLQ